MRLCRGLCTVPIVSDFNPRTRTGCDSAKSGCFESCSYFNPRTRTGCDDTDLATTLFDLSFQSTHPHGVRPLVKKFGTQPADFNPRTRTGCDTSSKRIHFRQTNFNPRTRTGCDKSSPSQSHQPVLFQSTHPHGVRPVFNFGYSDY